MAHPLHKGFYQQGVFSRRSVMWWKRKAKASNGLMARVMCGSRYC